MASTATVIEHPNRETAASKATRAIVVALLIVSAILVTVITVGGWDTLEGARATTVGFAVVYVVAAGFIARWNRGLLPVASGLATVLLIFAAVAGPGWLDRDRPGFHDPPIDESVLGALTLALVPVQALLVAFAMRGFLQKWNVEVERPAPA
jgi:hypothetical protein